MKERPGSLVRRVTSAATLMAALLLSTVPAEAQWALSVQHMSTYDNNSFSFYDQRADVYHQTFAAASKDFSSDYSFTQMFYYGAVVLFRTYDARTYHQHTLGTYYQLQLDHRGDDDGEADPGEEIDAVPDADTSEKNGAETEVVEEEDDSSSADSTELSEEDSADSTDITDEDSEDESGADAAEESHVSIDSSQTSVQPPGNGATSHVPSRMPSVEQVGAGHTVPAEEGAAVLPPDSLVSFLILKPTLGGRFDKADFDFYDYQSAMFNALVRKSLLVGIMSRVQYEIEYKRYPNFEQFTHLEHNAILTLNRRLGSAIEVFLSADGGYKSYLKTSSDTTILGTGNSGKGKGGVKNKKVSVTTLTTPSASQLTLVMGFTGPIVTTGSWSLSYLRRINPKSKARFVDPRIIDAGTEDAFFDDRYGYSGDEVEANLQAKLFAGIGLTISGAFHSKAYPRAATDLLGAELPGSPQRRDLRSSITVQFLYPLIAASSGAPILSIGAGYNFYRNQSNDLYHDYSIQQGTLVMEANF